MLRILLVDDVAARGVAAVMAERAERRVLPIRGAEWTVATTLKEAETALELGRATGREIDIVVLDLDLPDSDTEATVQKVERSAATWPAIFIVSNFASEEVRLRALRAGVEDVMDKSRMQDIPLDFLERLWQAWIRHGSKRVEAARAA